MERYRFAIHSRLAPIRAFGAQGGSTRDSHDLRTKAMLVRFTPAEFALVQEHARSCRRTVARYVRETTLGSVPHTRRNHDVDAMLYQLGRIGNNVNQLAHVANATDRFPTAELLTAVLDELRALIRHLAGRGNAS